MKQIHHLTTCVISKEEDQEWKSKLKSLEHYLGWCNVHNDPFIALLQHSLHAVVGNIGFAWGRWGNNHSWFIIIHNIKELALQGSEHHLCQQWEEHATKTNIAICFQNNFLNLTRNDWELQTHEEMYRKTWRTYVILSEERTVMLFSNWRRVCMWKMESEFK